MASAGAGARSEFDAQSRLQVLSEAVDATSRRLGVLRADNLQLRQQLDRVTRALGASSHDAAYTHAVCLAGYLKLASRWVDQVLGHGPAGEPEDLPTRLHVLVDRYEIAVERCADLERTLGVAAKGVERAQVNPEHEVATDRGWIRVGRLRLGYRVEAGRLVVDDGDRLAIGQAIDGFAPSMRAIDVGVETTRGRRLRLVTAGMRLAIDDDGTIWDLHTGAAVEPACDDQLTGASVARVLGVLS